MLLLLAAAWACCSSRATDQIPDAAYGFQGRLVAVRPDLPRGPGTAVEVHVRHVWRGDVPEVVILWLNSAATTSPTLAIGDEVLVAAETLPTPLGCNAQAIVAGTLPKHLPPPVRSYALPPGPHELYREALAHCDAGELARWRSSDILEDLSPLAHCAPDQILPFLHDSPPDWLVRDAPLATVLVVAAERPDLVEDIARDAVGWGRGDILGALVDRVAEPAEVLYIGNAGTEVATLRIVLARTESTDEERSRKLWHSFEPADDGPYRPSFPRDQRHDAARFLVGQGVEV